MVSDEPNRVNPFALASRTLRARRSLVTIMVCLGLAACSDAGEVRAATDTPRNDFSLPDGRRIHLQCAGRGSPTVILESGFGADSGAWYKVQTPLSRSTRTCAYDRAGSGQLLHLGLHESSCSVQRAVSYVARQSLRQRQLPGP